MNVFDFYNELIRALEELISEYGRFPTCDEIAKYMNVPLYKIGIIRSAKETLLLQMLLPAVSRIDAAGLLCGLQGLL